MAALVPNEEQVRLDREIAAMASMLCKLRVQRNTLSPVSRLPPEILTSIFIRYAGTPQLRQPGSGIPDWVYITHVCRHWRNVALSCPTLWSHLFVSSQQWTDLQLTRSKTAPLKVCVDSEYHKQSKELNLLKRVAPRADRIQDLNLRLTHREAERILSLFSLPAPLLQRLRISMERSNFLGEPALNLTGDLFDGHTPALRSLELIKYAFPLTSPTLRGLTSLRLRDLGTPFQPTLAEIQVVLGRMQDLVYLHLENALSSARDNSSGQPFESPELLRFPRLSRLSIVAPFSTVVLLLSRFDLPLKTEVRLRCSYEADVGDYTPVYPLLAKRFNATEDQAPVIHTCFIEGVSATVGFTFSATERDSDRRAFSTSATAYDLGQLHEDWDCNIPLKVDIVLRTSLSRDREDIITGICRSMPLASLQSVHFDFDVKTALSPAWWQETFGHLGELRHIRLSEVDLQGLVRVLNLEPGSGQIFASALEELEFCTTSLLKGGFVKAKDPCSCGAVATSLYDALVSRQVAGYGLRRVICDSHVDDLRGLVTRVGWDSGGESQA